MRASRTDYEQVAKLIRHMEKGQTKRIMWALGLADILRRSNPLFDKRKFVAAVTEEDGKVIHRTGKRA